jgi:hypothetical protein
MRIVVLALMMILLPLRGWMGDAMAMEMAVDELHATHTIAATANNTGAGATLLANLKSTHAPEHDCHDAAAQSPVDATDGRVVPDHTASTDCGSCSACQSCHAVGMLAMNHPTLGSAAPAVKATAGHPLLKGVTPDPGLKPPIS